MCCHLFFTCCCTIKSSLILFPLDATLNLLFVYFCILDIPTILQYCNPAQVHLQRLSICNYNNKNSTMSLKIYPYTYLMVIPYNIIVVDNVVCVPKLPVSLRYHVCCVVMCKPSGNKICHYLRLARMFS